MSGRSRREWDEDPVEDDFDDTNETVACPHCGEPVYEDAEQCPYCGDYIVPGGSTSVLGGKPFWYVALAMLGIFAVIVGMLAAV